MKKAGALLVLFLIFACPIVSSGKSEKFAIFVTGGDDSRAVVQSLVQKLRNSKPFEPVAKDDVSKAVVLVDCTHRDKESLPIACMYVLHYNGATLKTFMGGGLYLSMSADDMADNLLAAIAADIVERFDSTAKDNVRQSLESCLFLTDSKCNVPEQLQTELGATQMSLGQYLIKRNK
jgi:hypothetical protein